MNILAINFDLNWFLTIPGMLITGGVLLLLIALIIFIATAGTGKQKEKNKKNVENLVNSQNNNETSSQEAAPVANTEVSSVPINEVSPNVVTEVQPVSEVVNNNVAEPVVEPITQNVTPVEPVANTEVSSIPVNDVNHNNVIPEVQPISEVVNNNMTAPTEEPIPQGEEKTQIDAQETNNQPIEEPSVSIYGGVSPIIPDIDTGANERPIYGGANPMDATQTIPVIKPHVEYGVPVEEPTESVKPENNVNSAVESIANFQAIETPEPLKVETPVASPQPVEATPTVEMEPQIDIPQVTEQPKIEEPAVNPEPTKKEEPEIEILDF